MHALDPVTIVAFQKLLPWGIYLNSVLMNKEILLLQTTWNWI